MTTFHVFEGQTERGRKQVLVSADEYLGGNKMADYFVPGTKDIKHIGNVEIESGETPLDEIFESVL